MGSSPAGTMRAALRHQDFRRLLAALATSQAGDWLYNLALLSFVFTATHSTLWVGVTTAARVLPIVVLGPVGGVLADRFDRRRLMIVSDLVRAALMVLLAWVVLASAPVVLAPLLAAASTAAASVYAPCAAASTARLVPDLDLPAANAARSVVGQVCIVAGPAGGGLLLLLGSPALAFLVNAVTFLVSALLVARICAGPHFRPSATTSPAGGLWEDVAAGARALRDHPAALRPVGADIACSLLYGAQTVLLVLVADRFGLVGQGYGFLLGAAGLGGVLVTGIAGRAMATTHPDGLLASALLAAALPLTLLLLVPSFVAAAALMAVAGAGAVLVEVLAETALQRSLPPEVFSRAYGLALPASLGGIVVGSLVAAPLVALAGVGGALAVLGLGIAAGAFLLVPVRAVRRHRGRRGASATEGLPEPSLASK
jgi:MFS family permease